MNRSSDSYLQELIRRIESGDIELNASSVRVIQRYGRHPAEFFTWTELGDALTPKEMLDLELMPENIYRQVVEFQDEDENVRSKVARALGKIGDSSAIPALIPLLQDENANVCYEAVLALGHIGDPSVIPNLILALQDEYWPARSSAASALGKIGDSSVIPAIIPLLQDEHENVRCEVARALRELGYES